jgi:hypothetical protein
MAKPTKLDDPQAQAAALGIPERILLFCIASRTKWARGAAHDGRRVAIMARRIVHSKGRRPWRSKAQAAADARYKRSAKGKAANARYKRSTKGKVANARYRRSAKGRKTSARYEARRRRTKASR